jgi:hypothetical protein
MIDHYKARTRLPIYNDWTRIVPPTLDAKVVRPKPYSLNDELHILKELEYALPIIPHLEVYYVIYWLQTYILVGFTRPMLNAHILVDDFKHMWKI